MTDDVKAAAERIKAAVGDRGASPVRSFVEVNAADVALVGGLVPADGHTDVTRALVAGATGANPKGDPELKVHQYADQLGKLLDAAGV